MLRSIVGVILGLVVAIVVIFGIEAINFVLFPMPEGMDMNDSVAMSRYIGTLPLTAFLVVLAAIAAGTLLGSFLAAKIAGWKPQVHAYIIGGLLLLASIMNLGSIPHPLWFGIINLAMILPIAWVGAQLATPRRTLI